MRLPGARDEAAQITPRRVDDMPVNGARGRVSFLRRPNDRADAVTRLAPPTAGVSPLPVTPYSAGGSTSSPSAGGWLVSMYEPTPYSEALADGRFFSSNTRSISQPSTAISNCERVYW